MTLQTCLKFANLKISTCSATPYLLGVSSSKTGPRFFFFGTHNSDPANHIYQSCCSTPSEEWPSGIYL